MRAEQQQSKMKRSPSQSIASTSTEDDSDSSQIVSVQDQVVMYNGGSNTSNGGSDSRVALINKLERELTDAQLCNLRLNAKIGTLVSDGNATIKKEVLDLKVSISGSVQRC
ncbi:hypothetical protein GCK32_007702 [Trichostrongylus colubriformis]|uniref:Uncharacterized protein n=1 Tax=Trichostrongylus colubriformis TaxID=6319 RepID=A0AAN8F138_TRICO